MSDARPAGELRRVLGRREVLGLAFGAMVGWGWVVLAGDMILGAGSLGSILAFGIGATMVFFVGFTYAELTSALSRAGGELGFTYAALGSGWSFACGWTLALAYVSVCAFEAVALPTVLVYLAPGLEVGFLWTIAGWDVYVTWVAVGAGGALAIGALNWFGMRVASALQWVAALALLAVGLAFFIPGLATGEPAKLAPHFTDAQGLLGVVVMTPFLFLGFDVIPQIAEEIAVPFRVVGRLLVFSIGIALVWYTLVQVTVALTLDRTELLGAELVTADAMSSVWGSPWAGRLLVVGGLLGIVTSWNAFFIGGSRLLFAMGRAQMLPPVFGRLHPRYGSPVAAIVLLTAVSVLAPLFGRPALVWLVDAGGFAAVLAYALVAISFELLRRRRPDLPRAYRAPLPRFVGPCAVVVTLLFAMLYLPGSPAALAWPAEWGIVGVWTLAGGLLAFRARRGRLQLGAEEQARRVLGDEAARLLG